MKRKLLARQDLKRHDRVGEITAGQLFDVIHGGEYSKDPMPTDAKSTQERSHLLVNFVAKDFHKKEL